MQTSVTLSKEAQELLKESLEPTTTAAEVEAPAAPVINELQQVEQPAQQEAPAPIETVKQKIPMSDTMLEIGSDAVVGVLDTLQEWLFTQAAEKKKNEKAQKIAGDNARQRLNELISAELEKTEPQEKLSTTDQQLLELHRKITDYKSSVPFDEKTSENLKALLKEIAKKRDIQMSPENMFLVSLMLNVGTNFMMLKSI